MTQTLFIRETLIIRKSNIIIFVNYILLPEEISESRVNSFIRVTDLKSQIQTHFVYRIFSFIRFRDFLFFYLVCFLSFIDFCM